MSYVTEEDISKLRKIHASKPFSEHSPEVQFLLTYIDRKGFDISLKIKKIKDFRKIIDTINNTANRLEEENTKLKAELEKSRDAEFFEQREALRNTSAALKIADEALKKLIDADQEFEDWDMAEEARQKIKETLGEK